MRDARIHSMIFQSMNIVMKRKSNCNKERRATRNISCISWPYMVFLIVQIIGLLSPIGILINGIPEADFTGRPPTPSSSSSHAMTSAEYLEQSYKSSESPDDAVRQSTRHYSTGRLWPDTSTTHLCEELQSGKSMDNLEWTESIDILWGTITNKAKYNRYLAPGQTKGKTTEVRVAVYIESMSSFKAQSMDFEVDMYLAMSWFDHRLQHNCSHPVLISSKQVAEALWHPDLYFVNSKFAYFQEVTTPNFMVLIYPDGFVFKSLRVDVTLSCMMDLSRFPMDYQDCPLYIQSYAYVHNVLNLTWHIDEDAGYPIGTNPKIRLNDMVIIDRNWDYCGGSYPMFRGQGFWSCITARIKMKRLVMFHVIQTYIPTGMLVVISWLSFWLDPKSAPARVSLTITSLLTLTTMSNGARQDLPQVSYIKALDIWLSVCTAFVFSVLLEYTLVSYFDGKRTTQCQHMARNVQLLQDVANACQQPLLSAKDGSGGGGGGGGGGARIFRNELPQKPCAICTFNWETFAKRIDKVSRGGFPALFAVFVCTYWTYFLTTTLQ